VEFQCGNIYVRPSGVLAAGSVTGGHEHNFDHTTYIVSGAVRIKRIAPDGHSNVQDFSAGEWTLIRAQDHHEIVSLIDGTVFHCIYSHRNAQGEVVQTNEGWTKSYV
jgi:quercetin dioxygenase-like cupin family protein